MMGKPVIAGTRITGELILEKLAAGETIEEILEAHPRLTRKPFRKPWHLLQHDSEFSHSFSVISASGILAEP